MAGNQGIGSLSEDGDNEDAVMKKVDFDQDCCYKIGTGSTQCDPTTRRTATIARNPPNSTTQMSQRRRRKPHLNRLRSRLKPANILKINFF